MQLVTLVHLALNVCTSMQSGFEYSTVVASGRHRTEREREEKLTSGQTRGLARVMVKWPTVTGWKFSSLQ